MLGLHCCAGFSPAVESRGYSASMLVVVLRLLTEVASLVSEHRLQDAWTSVAVTLGIQGTGSIVVVHRLNCCVACRIFPPGIEPMSPALAGRFFTTEPPGNPSPSFIEI